MILALIKNNKIENTIVVESEDFAKHFPEHIGIILDNIEPRPGIGWSYDPATKTFQEPITE